MMLTDTAKRIRLTALREEIARGECDPVQLADLQSYAARLEEELSIPPRPTHTDRAWRTLNLESTRQEIRRLQVQESELEGLLGAYYHEDSGEHEDCTYGTADMSQEDPVSPLVCPHGFVVALHTRASIVVESYADDLEPPAPSGWVDWLTDPPFNLVDSWLHGGPLPFTEPARVDMPPLPTRAEAGASWRAHYKDVTRELQENGHERPRFASAMREAIQRLTTAERHVLGLDSTSDRKPR